MRHKHDPKFLRKRKFLMVLPLMVIPFLFFWFFSLGGGKATVADAAKPASRGFDTTLPSAHFDKEKKEMNKMAFYDRASQDSIKVAEKIKDDPYRTHAADNAHADRLLQKLGQLRQIVDQPAQPSTLTATAPDSRVVAEPGRMEKFVRQPNLNEEAAADPQMEKLNGMLDKILKIQHPGLEGVEAVPPSAIPTMTVTPLRAQVADPQGMDGFYTTDDPDPVDPSSHNTIGAVIDEDQTLVAGATLKLRLTEKTYIGGATIPENTLLYGRTSLDNDRMMLSIHSISYDRAVYPVSLQVYDLDGLPGIYIPGAMSRDVAKQSADQGINSMVLGSFDPSLGAQAANAGIQATKALLTKKVRAIRVFLRAGYHVQLMNTERKTVKE